MMVDPPVGQAVRGFFTPTRSPSSGEDFVLATT